MTDRIRLRRLSGLTYYDPRPVLAALRRVEYVVAASPTPDHIKNLRTAGLKEWRERRDAAIFAIGMSEWMGVPVFIAPVEEEDFDFVAKWTDGERTEHFCRVQLKEVVPEHLNPTASLKEVIDGLSRYADASDLTVAIKMNRQIRFDPADIRVPDTLKLGALWIYSGLSEDQSKFGIWGNFARRDAPATGRVFFYPSEAAA